MFNAVPPHYDVTNHAITLWLDSGWRRAAARECLAGQPRIFLDLCCGTADLAVAVAAGKPDAQVTGLDYSQPMLDIARRKAADRGVNIRLVPGDASQMPFPDASFDCVGISFAFRNLTYKNPLVQKHLSEVFRVVRPGGRFVIVESSQPANRIIRVISHAYERTYVRWMGTWITGNRGAYRYLSESVSRFYTSEEVRAMLLKTGFKSVTARPLLFGAAAVHVATK